MAYNFLQGWVDARSVDISESSNEFLDVVARQLTRRRVPLPRSSRPEVQAALGAASRPA